MKNKKIVLILSLLVLSIALVVVACDSGANEVKKYSISYSGVSEEEKVGLPTEHVEGEITVIPGVQRLGYEFLGWNYDSGLMDVLPKEGGEYILETSEDVTLYTGFSVQTYSIEYELDGGELGEGTPTNHTYGRDTILVEASKELYTFTGWYDNAEFSGYAITVLDGYAYTDVVTLYAKWATYIIEFRDMDGSELSDEYDLPRYTHTNGEQTALPTLAHSGQIVGATWTLAVYGEGAKYSTLYADMTYVGENGVLTLYINWTLGGVGYDAVDYGYAVKAIGQISGEIEIPEYYNGLPVTQVAESGFREADSITKIILPDSIINIGSYAFYECSGLVEIILPDSITIINSYTFTGCSNLVKVDLPNSITTIKDIAFYGCTSLVDVVLPNSVTAIGSQAFRDCVSLVKIFLPNSLFDVGSAAFDGCTSLETITIPENVGSLGGGIFGNSGSNNLAMKVTIYIEVVSRPGLWSVNWNSFLDNELNHTTIVWGCAMSAENRISYVSSVSKNINTIVKGNASSHIYPPARYGYEFKYWLNSGGLRYDSLDEVPNGTTVEPLYE